MALAVALLVAVVGLVLLARSQAATATVSQEAEAGVTAGRIASGCTDAGASGGQTVKFGWSTCTQQQLTFRNPVKPEAADPGVLAWEGRYYMVYTTGDPWFPIYVSDDLVNWEFTGRNVFNGLGTHPWGTIQFWAPELHRVGNGFAVYYSASDGAMLRVGVAFADSITGAYTDLGRPLISESYGVIDVNFFRDDDGRNYLYWKEDGGDTRIFGREIDQNGSGFIGNRVEVLRKGLAWEGAKGIEAPWVQKKDGRYYMYYSGELFSSEKYSVGVARANSPLTPFSKKGDPILRSNQAWIGPGHNSVVRAGQNDYMVYHAYDNKETVRTRKTLVDKITWSNGWPAVANGTPTEGQQAYPQ